MRVLETEINTFTKIVTVYKFNPLELRNHVCSRWIIGSNMNLTSDLYRYDLFEVEITLFQVPGTY